MSLNFCLCVYCESVSDACILKIIYYYYNLCVHVHTPLV